MKPKQRLAYYEERLNALADWGMSKKDMALTDDNGAGAMWAREVLIATGAASPIHDKE